MATFAGTPRRNPTPTAEAPPEHEEGHAYEPEVQDGHPEPNLRPPEHQEHEQLPTMPSAGGTVVDAFVRMAEVLDRLGTTERVSLSIPVTGASDLSSVLTLELTCAKAQVLADCVNLLYDTSTSTPRIPYGVQMMLKTGDGTEVSVMSLGHSFQFEGTNWQLMSFVVTGPSES